MMYLALSYDHRIIDGREAVSFLVQSKRKHRKSTTDINWSLVLMSEKNYDLMLLVLVLVDMLHQLWRRKKE